MRRFAVCSLVIAAACAAGCSGNSSGLDQPRQGESRAGPVTDYASLAANLRAAGASVKPGDEVDQPFFSVTGKMMQVHGEEVQVFQFANAAVADAQAARISPTGSAVGTTKVHWIGPPHFYRKGKLLVLYVGDNDQVLKALQAALGRQFAGQ
jgi:hypothetical protein